MSSSLNPEQKKASDNFLLGRYVQRRLFLSPTDSPLIISHRGSGRSSKRNPFPENTLPGIVNAWESGFPCVEVDVRLTRDGVAVLRHDAQVPFRTGKKYPLRELDFRDLPQAALALGTACPDPKIRIPTLDVLLGLAMEQESRNPAPCLHLDLKTEPSETRTLETAERALDMVISRKLLSRVIFSTRRGEVVDMIRSKAADAFIFFSSPFWPPKGIKLAQVHRADAFGTYHLWTISSFIRQIQDAGMCFIAFIPSHPWHLSRLTRLGADAIVTDRPGVLRKILVARGTVITEDLR